LVFGRNSSPTQRRIAKELASFSVNPLAQRNLTLSTLVMLPVNRFVPAPVASSAVLAAMVRSAEQSEQTTPLIQALISNQKAERALSAMVSRVLFGELSPRQGAELLPVSLRTALRGSDP
jgi:hypothetical protein